MSSLPTRTTEATAARSRRKFTVDALFTDHRPQAVGVTDLATAKEIRLDRIEPDPDQPRRTFDPAKLDELAASIRQEGVLQPIAVRYEAARDVYVVVHGERRFRAAPQVGLKTIPAVVRDVPVERRLVQQLMENIVRDDLNAVDRAAALRALKAQLGDVPWETVAETVGIRRSRLFQLLGTEKLSTQAQDDIRAGRLSEKQSRALQGLPPASEAALRAAMIEDELPASEAVRVARALRDGPAPVDEQAARDTVGRLRSTAANQSAHRERSLDQLLVAITSATRDRRPDKPVLAKASNSRGDAPDDIDQLRVEVLSLAGLITRASAVDLAPGGDAHGPLAALRDLLDAVLTPLETEHRSSGRSR